MGATRAARGAIARVSWRAIERARWVAIQVEALDGSLAGPVSDIVARVPGVITVEAQPDTHTVVIAFDPAVTAPGALADVVAGVAANADRAVRGAAMAMRTGSLRRPDPAAP